MNAFTPQVVAEMRVSIEQRVDDFVRRNRTGGNVRFRRRICLSIAFVSDF